MTATDRPGPPTEEPWATLSLLDYRRRAADLYAAVRSSEPEHGHRLWIEGRNALFRRHPQSPVAPAARDGFSGLAVYPYDPSLRFELEVQPVGAQTIHLGHSGAGSTRAIAFGDVTVPIGPEPGRLTLFWLDQYGGGVFLPFLDATSGSETYGGGRYLLDTAKGADLGSSNGRIVLDFNFAFHPSCVHDSSWSCPLAPPNNRLAAAVTGGERL
jgi:uncharacterized protein (DUF1684 family)